MPSTRPSKRIAHDAGAWWEYLKPPGGRIVVPDSTLDGFVSLVTDGLTFARLRSRINAALRGDLATGLELFEEMESKDGRLKSVASVRRRSLTGLEWEVVSAADVQGDLADRALADEAAAFVRETLTNLESFEEATEHLATGIGPNLSVLELVWNNGILVDFVDVPSTRLTTDPREPGVVRVVTDENRDGLPATIPKFVVHMPHGRDLFPFRKSLSRPQAMIYLAKALALADWKVFCEIFGMPTRIGTYEPGAKDSEKQELVDMLQNVGTKAWGAFSRSVNLTLLESSQRGTAPYGEFIEFCSRETAILWLGGNLTTDTTGGTGTFAAGAVQDDVKDDLRDDDIKRESRTIGRQIIKPMCRFRFWGDVPLPRFRRKKPEVVDLLKEADLFGKAQLSGMKIGRKYAHSRLGIPEPEPDEEVLERPDAFDAGVTEGFSLGAS